MQGKLQYNSSEHQFRTEINVGDKEKRKLITQNQTSDVSPKRGINLN
jgi:hypothetical protein